MNSQVPAGYRKIVDGYVVDLLMKTGCREDWKQYKKREELPF